MSRTPATLPIYPGPPRCAQCGKVFGKVAPRYRNVWGEVCQDCHQAGATLLQPTPPTLNRALGKVAVRFDPRAGDDIWTLMTLVAAALNETGQRELARAFTQDALECHHLSEVLALAGTYVTITREESE